MSEEYIAAMIAAMEAELGAQAQAYRDKEKQNHYGLGRYAGAKEDTDMSLNNKSIPRKAACHDPLASFNHMTGGQLSAILDEADILDNGDPMPVDAELTPEEAAQEEYMQRVVEDLQAREGAEAIRSESSVRHFLNQIRSGRV